MEEPLRDAVDGVVLEVRGAAVSAALEHLEGLDEPKKKVLLRRLAEARLQSERRVEIVELGLDVLEGVLRKGVKAALV